jgi:hypothetical protein
MRAGKRLDFVPLSPLVSQQAASTKAAAGCAQSKGFAHRFKTRRLT